MDGLNCDVCGVGAFYEFILSTGRCQRCFLAHGTSEVPTVARSRARRQAILRFMSSHPNKTVSQVAEIFNCSYDTVRAAAITVGRCGVGYKRDDERDQTVLELAMDGLTLAEIGQRLTPPVSRERVRQLLQRVDPDGTKRKNPRQLPKRTGTCAFPHCGKPFVVTAHDPRKFCSKTCVTWYLSWSRSPLRDQEDKIMSMRKNRVPWIQVAHAIGWTAGWTHLPSAFRRWCEKFRPEYRAIIRVNPLPLNVLEVDKIRRLRAQKSTWEEIAPQISGGRSASTLRQRYNAVLKRME